MLLHLLLPRQPVRQPLLAAQRLHEQLEEAVYDERLVALAQEVKVEGEVGVGEAEPAGPRVYGHHRDDADDVAAEAGGGVPVQVLADLVDGGEGGHDAEGPGDPSQH